MAAPGLVILLLCAAACVVLAVVAAPTAVFKAKNNDGCITLWGIKSECGSTDYVCKFKDDNCKLLLCDDAVERMKGAASFAIITIICCAAAALCCLLGLLMKMVMMRIVASAVGIFGAIGAMIVFALAASLWQQEICGSGTALKDTNMYKYAEAFALCIVVFAVMLIGSIVNIVMKAEF